MKNRIEKESKPRLDKITIELWPDEHAGLKKMARILGATVQQTAASLLHGQSEDHLGREGDDIWFHCVEHIQETYGDTPRLKLMRRYLAACNANADLPSSSERKVLFKSALDTLETYRAYLRKIGANEMDTDRRGV